jgi:hypothetical protein
MSSTNAFDPGAKNEEEGNSAGRIAAEIRRRVADGTLPCAVAFDIAQALGVTPAAVGKTADEIYVRLAKCQLGLFGYAPQKKIVRPRMPDQPAVRPAIQADLQDGRISCRSAWDIARRLGVAKMTVSNACEAMGVKIKPCQLGAF